MLLFVDANVIIIIIIIIILTIIIMIMIIIIITLYLTRVTSITDDSVVYIMALPKLHCSLIELFVKRDLTVIPIFPPLFTA